MGRSFFYRYACSLLAYNSHAGRRIACGIMTGSLLMGLYGCSAAENTVAVDTQQQETTQESLEPVTFTFYSADGLEDTWTDPVAQMITEKTGVTLKMDYPADSNDNRIELMVATGEYPDFVFAKGSVSTLIRNDALIDMSDLIDEYGPNIKKLYGDEYENLRYSSEDPSIYQLCSDKVQEETLETSGTAQLQWAVLQENQYRVPYTLEEYTQMIRDYMEKYPMINGKPVIGISIVCSDWHWYIMLSNPSGYMNGSADNGQWIVDDEKQEVYYKHAADGQKEYYKQQNLAVGWGIGITKSCKDPVRAVRFLDWLCSDEAQILLNWGIEGVDYYYDENGKRCITEEDLEASRKDTNYSERTGVGFRVYPYPSYGNQSVDSTGNSYSKSSREMIKEGYDEMEKEALKAWNVDMLTDIFPQKEEFSKDAYSPLWALTLPDELEKMLVALDNVSWKGLIECVVSPADDFDAKWDELQQNLKDAGLEKADREMTALLRDEISRRE